MEIDSVPKQCHAGELDYYKGRFGYIREMGDDPKIHIYKLSHKVGMFVKRMVVKKEDCEALQTILSNAICDLEK